MKEFVMRGQTASGMTHTINFSGHKGDYGFRLIEFDLFPSTSLGEPIYFQLSGSVTAAKEAQLSTEPDFSSEGLIANTMFQHHDGLWSISHASVVNDTFIITQDIILQVQDMGSHPDDGHPVNWQLKFMPVKLSTTEAALTNYRQFSIFDE